MPDGASGQSGGVVQFVASDTGADWLVDARLTQGMQ
jgi:hypothetical protein